MVSSHLNIPCSTSLLFAPDRNQSFACITEYNLSVIQCERLVDEAVFAHHKFLAFILILTNGLETTTCFLRPLMGTVAQVLQLLFNKFF